VHAQQTISIYVFLKKILPNFTSIINYIFPEQNYNVLSGIKKFCFTRSGHSSVSHWKQHISKRNHISRLELQYNDSSLDLLFPFLKYIFSIWDCGLANSFWDNVIQISSRHMNFHYIFPNYEKLNPLGKHILPAINNVFSWNRCLIWIFIFDKAISHECFFQLYILKVLSSEIDPAEIRLIR
jgi:hypothetical protein